MGCGISRRVAEQNVSDNSNNDQTNLSHKEDIENGKTVLGPADGPKPSPRPIKRPTPKVDDGTGETSLSSQKKRENEGRKSVTDLTVGPKKVVETESRPSSRPTTNKDENQIVSKEHATTSNEGDATANRKISKIQGDSANFDLKGQIFLEKAQKVVDSINTMSMELEDMPENYDKVKTLRQLYHKARYDHGEEFCKTFIDSLIEIDVVPCITHAFRKIQTAYPTLFTDSFENEGVNK